MLQVVTAGPHARLGTVGQIFIAIQCGCGWTVIVTDPDGRESNYDLRDRAESELATHLSADESDTCRMWIR